MVFTVEENDIYTIYALNAEGVAALSTITVSNITEFIDSTDIGDVTELREHTGSKEDTDSNDKDKTLPPTAATNLFNLLVIGGTMLTVGFTFIIFTRKQYEDSEEQWTDESLKEVQTAFGRDETNAQIFMGLIKHIVHHRGPFSILLVTRRKLYN